MANSAPFPPARRVAGSVLSVGLTALLLTSCASPQFAAGGGSAVREESAQASAPEMADGVQSEEAADGGGSIGSDLEIEDRHLIHTADMAVRVEDVPEAAERAKELTIGLGGYVASEQVYTPTSGAPSASLTLRIPDGGYEGALTSLAELGDRSDLERSVEDVSEEVADVESRVESAEASLETLRGYLEEAEDVDDLLRVEQEIQSRQSELEAFQARLESLSNLTAYSTVHLRLSPPKTYLEERPGESVGFVGGLERGWVALVTLGQWIAVGLGWALPFLVIAVVVGAGPLWWYRSRRARHSAGDGRSPSRSRFSLKRAPKGGAPEEAGSEAPDGDGSGDGTGDQSGQDGPDDQGEDQRM